MAGRKRQPINHGTRAGAQAHRRRGVPLCDPCREAEREYARKYQRKIAAGEHTPTKPKPAECGTQNGYFRHYRKREKTCKRCRAAHAAAIKEYRETHPEYVEQSRQWDREYSRRSEVRKKLYARQAEEQRTPGTPRYYRQRARLRRRDAARRGSEVNHGVSRKGLAGKLVLWGRRCWLCRVELDDTGLTWDHVKPLSKGGVDILANLRPCCGPCNSKKGNKWPISEVIK